jgi:hypothetical protein
MLDLCRFILGMVIDLLRSRVALEAEILVLRQQINVLRRTRPRRPPFISIDRLILGGVCRLFPKMYDALAIVRPDTVIRWHRYRPDQRGQVYGAEEGPSVARLEDVPS